MDPCGCPQILDMVGMADQGCSDCWTEKDSRVAHRLRGKECCVSGISSMGLEMRDVTHAYIWTR